VLLGLHREKKVERQLKGLLVVGKNHRRKLRVELGKEVLQRRGGELVLASDVVEKSNLATLVCVSAFIVYIYQIE
jgi:hypothetical protein